MGEPEPQIELGEAPASSTALYSGRRNQHMSDAVIMNQKQRAE
jgi:hypothetical protein